MHITLNDNDSFLWEKKKKKWHWNGTENYYLTRICFANKGREKNVCTTTSFHEWKTEQRDEIKNRRFFFALPSYRPVYSTVLNYVITFFFISCSHFFCSQRTVHSAVHTYIAKKKLNEK